MAKTTEKKKPQLTFSKINMIMRCGEQYRRRWIEGDKAPPGRAAIVGTGAHKAAERNYKQIATDGKPVAVEELQDIARDEAKKRLEDGLLMTPEDKEQGIKSVRAEIIDEVVKRAAFHAENVAPLRIPKSVNHVERAIVLNLEGYPYNLSMRIDLDTVDDEICDYKNTGKYPSKTAADDSLQLTMYAMGKSVVDGIMPKAVHLDHVVRAPTGKRVLSYRPQSSTRKKEDFNLILRRVAMASRVIESGAYMPARPGEDWWCLSMDTEILTPGGWAGPGEIHKGDSVLTLNPYSHLLEWQHTNRVFTKKHGKRMVRYHGRSIRFNVTPDHRMLVRSSGRSRWRWTTAEAIEGKCSIGFPVSGILPRGGVDVVDEMLELSGWLCAEGHFRKDTHIIEIAQKKNTTGWHRIQSLLISLGLKHSIWMSGFRILGDDAKRIRSEHQDSKAIPHWIHRADARQFRVWLSGFIQGDGSVNGNSWSVSQKDEGFIDELQVLCVTNRMSATKADRRKSSTGGEFSGLTILDGITERFVESGVVRPSWRSDEYADRVWCVSVPNETIVTRYRGRVLITGNCTEKWCGYAKSCPFFRGKVSFAIGGGG